MAAEVHLRYRGKPPQVPAIGEGRNKCGFRMPQFTGDLLHPRGIGRAFQDADRSGVPAEREPGKGIYYVQLVTHDSGLVRLANKVYGECNDR